MPLVRIDLAKGKSIEFRRTVGDIVYAATVNTINVPQNDRFQVITEHDPEMFIFDPSYLGIARSADCIFIQITLNTGRTTDAKKSLFKAIVDGMQARLNHRPEDVFIGLVETNKENWSFGNGLAQYAA
ncbi:tautomerase family protein [Comamonas sp. w2-DMI]|uniref:Probable tautomerase n=1 Tax=Bordetella petrii (strain ATCC BAA-461 / DSM 12804 / CCUG 43448 / CIP 107267 / Se-1111R) TaxID=340100 RepID=A9IL59_BORPD|nr:MULTISPECIES: tautomerase family protein [Alcaligenaceae]OSZ42882.1 tautomerase family protein [Alcaligenes faecalis]OSZ52688.1 tautomerase family protein [Alcaligenes faecalis]UUO09418.1 tautomerase family protein [Alcaligenes faecalis]CAP42543.1 Probable tautomerase [Bordetella petrii]